MTASRIALTPRIRQWVFCAGTGRCGTTTLSGLLGAHPDVHAEHEPFPQADGDLLRAYSAGDADAMRVFFRSEKLPRMAYAARRSSVYAEASYLFISTIADAAARRLGPRMTVIGLSRDARVTARSFLARGMDPASDPWLPHPQEAATLLRLGDDLAPGGRFDHPYLRLIWYIFEIRARTQKFRADHPEVGFHAMTTEDLNDRDAVSAMLSAIGLTPDEAVLSRCGHRANASKTPPDEATPCDPALVEALEAALDAAYRATGIGARTGETSIMDPPAHRAAA